MFEHQVLRFGVNRSVGAFKLANMLFIAHKKIDNFDKAKDSPEELWKSLYTMYFRILEEVLECKKQIQLYKKDLHVDLEIVPRLMKEAGYEPESQNVHRATCCTGCIIF